MTSLLDAMRRLQTMSLAEIRREAERDDAAERTVALYRDLQARR